MDKNEETISLTKCDNSILADEIVSKLANAGIASSLHDELNDPAYGAYGPNPGIEVRVFKKDLERAQSILKEITEKREKQLPWCPNCGSQNVVALGKVRPKLSKWAVIIGVLLVVIGIVCIILPFCVKSLESATVSFRRRGNSPWITPALLTKYLSTTEHEERQVADSMHLCPQPLYL